MFSAAGETAITGLPTLSRGGAVKLSGHLRLQALGGSSRKQVLSVQEGAMGVISCRPENCPVL